MDFSYEDSCFSKWPDHARNAYGFNLWLQDGFEDLGIDKDYIKMHLQETGLERVDYSSG